MRARLLSCSALAGLLSCASQTGSMGGLPSADFGLEPVASEERQLQGWIVVCGERFPVAAPVVPWTDPPFYDAHSTLPRFGEDGPRGMRYAPGRSARNSQLAREVRDSGWTLERLRRQVDLFVLHYDACGLSRTCFQVLHDERELSVHFLLDVDGTIYQTLDLSHQAWHARQANARSIGIEIAHVGAYPPESESPLDEWYLPDARGTRLAIPARFGGGDVRTAGFRGRPARPGRIVGEIHGERFAQYDFTPEQYASLVELTAALTRAFPGIALDAPRDVEGRVHSRALDEAEFDRFRGVLGHYHVSGDKRDPGPAFDWESFLKRVRRAREET